MADTDKKDLILEGNKLLARYLGYEYYPHSETANHVNKGWWNKEFIESAKVVHPKVHWQYFLCRTHKELRFYNDWNLLMRVYSKILKEPLYEANDEELDILMIIVCDNLLDSDREDFFLSLVKVVQYLKNN